MQKSHRPHFTVSLPRPERSQLVAEIKRKLPGSTNAEIASALHLASALLTPAVSRPRLVTVAEFLLNSPQPRLGSITE